MPTIDRFRGALLGLAAGDALGATLEFRSPGSFSPIETIVGGGPFGLQPGQWTDDTSMALCLADSLIAQQRFDAEDQARRYCRWWRDGYLSSNGRCFDIGITTSAALRRFEEFGQPFAGSEDPQLAGNGSLMRLAPIPLVYYRNPLQAERWAEQSSRITHATRTTISACRYFSRLLVQALQGRTKSEIFAPSGYAEDLAQPVAVVAGGSFLHKQPPEIRGSGYVVESLEAALWAFHHSQSFAHGALLAVNLGDDADTTGAVYGQLAGAFYGIEGIPGEWLERLALRRSIQTMADHLYDLSQRS